MNWGCDSGGEGGVASIWCCCAAVKNSAAVGKRLEAEDKNIKYQIQNPKAIQSLKAIYNEIPDTDCPNCGKCCESVPISSLEFFNIMSFIQTFPVTEYNNEYHDNWNYPESQFPVGNQHIKPFNQERDSCHYRVTV